MRHRSLVLSTLCVALFVSLSLLARAEAVGAGSAAVAETVGAPVLFNGDTLFFVYGRLGPFGPADRAAAITQRLRQLSKDRGRARQPMEVSGSAESSDILLGDVIVMTVTAADAAPLGREHLAVARDYARIIGATLEQWVESTGRRGILVAVALALITTAVFFLVLRVLARVTAAICRLLESRRGTQIRSLRVQRWEIISADRLTDFFVGLVRLGRVALVLILCYVYLSLVFGYFPWTHGFAARLLSYVVSPLKTLGSGLLAYLPNLFFIAVAVVVTRLVLRFVRGLFLGIARGTIVLPGFYDDWAMPTYKIVRLLILVFAVVVMFPYIPGSSSPAFRGVSVFLGVLFSLGSTSAVANMVAGVLLTYMRPFKIGDRVKIADTIGDVIAKTLLVTHVRTIKNVDVTIPNALVLGNHIINFSAVAQTQKLILHTKVTIGYNAPWRKVHDLLITAGRATRFVLSDPPPFVLQTSLDDYFVSYELNVYTEEPNRMAGILAELHQNIQDQFNEAGLEIMSPQYTAVRDGNQMAIPLDYLPRDYEKPGFRIWGQNPGRDVSRA
jgi:small-conductance mechanosensitive channel